MLQTEYNQALSGSMHEAQQVSTMSASVAKTNWINSGLRSQVHSDNPRLVLLQYMSASHSLQCMILKHLNVVTAV